MSARLTRGTSVDGVIAYQDHVEPSQFHYLPARGDCVLGDTLNNFEVDYWGINAMPYYVQTGNDLINSVGGILSGQARLDISATQRTNIVNQIKQDFGIASPSLLPLSMTDVKVQPVIAQNAVDLGPDGRVTFPGQKAGESLQFGQSFVYNISAFNSLFATLAAGTSNSPVPRPTFGINVYGTVEFIGEPWKAKITCDLSQVWSYTRTQVSASGGWGWFSFGASYDKIVQDLVKNKIIKIEYEEGQGDPGEGRIFLDMAKKIFEAINQQALNGDGFFKFEPNPNPPPGQSGGGGGWPWSVSLNGGYTSSSFRQSIQFTEEMTYKGRIHVPMGSSMVLAVGCGDGTSKYFQDLQNTKQPCLTQVKLDGLQTRLKAEADAKRKKALEYLQKLEDGIWTPEKYRTMISILKTITLTEGANFLDIPTGKLPKGSKALSQQSLEENINRLRMLEAKG
jgi:hypothetical protein